MNTIEHVAVIGAGTMGRQIAWQTARCGLTVTLYDLDAAVLARARDAHRVQLAALVEAHTVPAGDADAIGRQLHYTTTLAAARDADVAIEAVPERLELKRRVRAARRDPRRRRDHRNQ